MINYIEQINDSNNIYTNNGVKYYNEYKKVINYIANLNFVDITKYNLLVRRNVGLKYNIPLNINDDTLLMKLDNYYINYHSLYAVAYNNDFIHIMFKDGSKLKINSNYLRIKKCIESSKKIINYLNELKQNF